MVTVVLSDLEGGFSNVMFDDMKWTVTGLRVNYLKFRLSVLMCQIDRQPSDFCVTDVKVSKDIWLTTDQYHQFRNGQDI